MFFFVIMKKKWLQNYPSEFKIVIYRRYVDDIFLLPHSKHHIEKLRNCLNHQHKNIRFTSETENENSISFIDIQRSRGNNQFTTSIHRKPPFSRVFPTLEASSRSHINTTFCLPYHRGHSNFAQF